MATERDRELRRLAKKHRIFFKPPVSSKAQWPSRHKNHFDKIDKIGAYTYEHFVASIDPLSDQHPWREKTKSRAEWLAKKALSLYHQQTNEAGWRFGIENDVFKRFAFEVSCSGCRARLWRSELEAAVETSDLEAVEMLERRQNRKSCQCPPEKKPRDDYEIGTNPLFDDRVQQVVVHNPLLAYELPQKEPDRVYGLRETNNFKDLFLCPTVRANNLRGESIGDSVHSSPFKDVSDPLLFPFLILEAKSEKSSSGFDAMSNQTAFPIMAIVKLQADLAHLVNDDKLNDGPLVWFFASRGDAWRVYGCYATEDTPIGYTILQLWEGSILSYDKALQLILIVDYIFDWARDIYRPSILRQLKSLTRNDSYDAISVANDSDIYPIRNVSSWVQPPPDIVDLTIEEWDPPPQNVSPPDPITGHQRTRLDFSGNYLSKYSDAFSSPHTSITRVVGLYLTESNVRSLLGWAGVSGQGENVSPAVCRAVINFVTQWDQIMLLSKKDLQDFEFLWTGSPAHRKDPLMDTDVPDTYVLLEYATYIDVSWRIMREMTYLAISREAFEILIEYADFPPKHDGISFISRFARPCGIDALEQLVTCLKSGSVDQTFLAAVCCSCFAVFLQPARWEFNTGPGDAEPAIGLVKVPHSRLRGHVAKYHAFYKPPASRRNDSPSPNSGKEIAQVSQIDKPENAFYPPDRSFIRISEQRLGLSVSQGHDDDTCHRCQRSEEKTSPYTRIERSPFAISGMALVTSLAFDQNKNGSPVLCLFALDFFGTKNKSSQHWLLNEQEKLAKILEDISRSENIYHTIQHPLPGSFTNPSSYYEVRWKTVIWNLKLPMHPLDSHQQGLVDFWVKRLRGEFVVDSWHDDMKDTWHSLQMTLYLLKTGQSWAQANRTVESHRTEIQKSIARSATVRGSRKLNGIVDMRSRLYSLYTLYLDQNSGNQREASPWRERGPAGNLCWRDGNVSEYTSAIWTS